MLHPGIKVDLEDVLSEEAARAVTTGVAELAVIGDNTPTEGLHTLKANSQRIHTLNPDTSSHTAPERTGCSCSPAVQASVND